MQTEIDSLPRSATWSETVFDATLREDKCFKRPYPAQFSTHVLFTFILTFSYWPLTRPYPAGVARRGFANLHYTFLHIAACETMIDSYFPSVEDNTDLRYYSAGYFFLCASLPPV